MYSEKITTIYFLTLLRAYLCLVPLTLLVLLSTGPKMFWASPIFFCQNLIAFRPLKKIMSPEKTEAN